MQSDLHLYIAGVWIVTGVVWLLAAAGTKRTAKTQTMGSRLLHISLVAAAFALLLEPQLGLGLLGRRFVPDSAALRYTGLALTLAGIGFAIWARVLLGRNWSATVTIKQDHEMIRSGPYRMVRHPIYSGFLLAFVGSALVSGEVRSLVAVLLAFLAWWLKSRLEEEFMEHQFGPGYTAYKQRVKALIPFVL